MRYRPFLVTTLLATALLSLASSEGTRRASTVGKRQLPTQYLCYLAPGDTALNCLYNNTQVTSYTNATKDYVQVQLIDGSEVDTAVNPDAVRAAYNSWMAIDDPKTADNRTSVFICPKSKISLDLGAVADAVTIRFGTATGDHARIVVSHRPTTDLQREKVGGIGAYLYTGGGGTPVVVKSHAATASSSGTTYSVEHSGNNTEVRVYEGQVSVVNTKNSHLKPVHEGNKNETADDQDPGGETGQ
jgi:hypothetical protein